MDRDPTRIVRYYGYAILMVVCVLLALFSHAGNPQPAPVESFAPSPEWVGYYTMLRNDQARLFSVSEMLLKTVRDHEARLQDIQRRLKALETPGPIAEPNTVHVMPQEPNQP